MSGLCPPVVLFLSASCPLLVLLLVCSLAAAASRSPDILLVSGEPYIRLLSSPVLFLSSCCRLLLVQMTACRHDTMTACGREAPSTSAIKRSSARKQLHTRKPCVAPSGKSPAGKRKDHSIPARVHALQSSEALARLSCLALSSHSLSFFFSSWCVGVVFLPSSFCTLLSSLCPLLSCCCRAAYAAFQGRGGAVPTKLFEFYAGIAEGFTALFLKPQNHLLAWYSAIATATAAQG